MVRWDFKNVEGFPCGGRKVWKCIGLGGFDDDLIIRGLIDPDRPGFRIVFRGRRNIGNGFTVDIDPPGACGDFADTWVEDVVE